MPIEIKNLSIKLNIAEANNTANRSNARSERKKTMKKENIIKIVEQVNKLKKER